MREKLGRLRKDTLKDIYAQRRKDKERKKPGLSNAFETKGSKKLILAKFDSWCSECGDTIHIGAFIWFDPNLPVTKRVMHRDCLPKD